MGWVVNVTPRPVYPREWTGTHCTGGWVGTQGRSGRMRIVKPTPRFDPRTAQPRSESLYLLSYPGSYFRFIKPKENVRFFLKLINQNASTIEHNKRSFIIAGDFKIGTQWAVFCVVMLKSGFETLIIFLAWDTLQRSQYVPKFSTRRRMFDYFLNSTTCLYDVLIRTSPYLRFLSCCLLWHMGVLPCGSVVMCHHLVPWEKLRPI